MTLKEDLIELSEVVPHLPEEVNGLGQSVQELAQSTSALLADVAAARQEVAVLMTQVRNTLPAFKVQVEALDRRVDTAADAAETAWSQGKAELETGEKGLHSAEEQLDTARKDLAKALIDAAALVDQAGAQGDAAIVHVESVVSKGQDRLRAAADALQHKIAAFGTVLDDVGKTLAEPVEDLCERAQQFADNAAFDTGAVLEHLAIRLGQYSEKVTEIVEDVAQESEVILVPFGTWLYDSVRTPLGLAAEKLGIELDALAAGVRSQQDAAMEGRDAHGTALDGLKAEAEPLPRAVGEIREAVTRMRQT